MKCQNATGGFLTLSGGDLGEGAAEGVKGSQCVWGWCRVFVSRSWTPEVSQKTHVGGLEAETR